MFYAYILYILYIPANAVFWFKQIVNTELFEWYFSIFARSVETIVIIIHLTIYSMLTFMYINAMGLSHVASKSLHLSCINYVTKINTIKQNPYLQQ